MPPTRPARETAVALHPWLSVAIAMAAVLMAAVGLAGCEQKVEQAPSVRPVRAVTVDKRTAGVPIVLTGVTTVSGRVPRTTSACTVSVGTRSRRQTSGYSCS
jgi:hypothetical protein